jgi:ankyrin repeat protein
MNIKNILLLSVFVYASIHGMESSEKISKKKRPINTYQAVFHDEWEQWKKECSALTEKWHEACWEQQTRTNQRVDFLWQLTNKAIIDEHERLEERKEEIRGRSLEYKKQEDKDAQKLCNLIKDKNLKELKTTLETVNPNICFDGVDDPFGGTPLFQAVSRANLNAVQLLLENGADITMQDRSYKTVLHMNIKDPDLFAYLIKNGANINALSGWDQGTVLHDTIALCTLDSIEKIKLLLKHGADVNIKNELGDTPLAHAIQYVNADAVDLLLANKTTCCMQTTCNEMMVCKAIGLCNFLDMLSSHYRDDKHYKKFDTSLHIIKSLINEGAATLLDTKIENCTVRSRIESEAVEELFEEAEKHIKKI